MKTRFEIVEEEVMLPGQMLSAPEAEGVRLTLEEAVLVLVRS